MNPTGSFGVGQETVVPTKSALTGFCSSDSIKQDSEHDQCCTSSGTARDTRQVHRVMANRKSAQRSRIRKLQNISVLEKNVDTVQDDLTKLSPQVVQLRTRYKELLAKNQQLKALLGRVLQDSQPKQQQQPQQPQSWQLPAFSSSAGQSMVNEVPLNAGLLAAQQAIIQAQTLAAAHSMVTQQAIMNAASQSTALNGSVKQESGNTAGAAGQLMQEALGALLQPLSAAHLQAVAQTLSGGMQQPAQSASPISNLQPNLPAALSMTLESAPNVAAHLQQLLNFTQPNLSASQPATLSSNAVGASDAHLQLQRALQVLSTMSNTAHLNGAQIRAAQMNVANINVTVNSAAPIQGMETTPDLTSPEATSFPAPLAPSPGNASSSVNDPSRWSVPFLAQSSISNQQMPGTSLFPNTASPSVKSEANASSDRAAADNHSSQTVSGRQEVLGCGTSGMCHSPASTVQLPMIKLEDEDVMTQGLNSSPAAEEQSLMSTGNLNSSLEHMDGMDGILSGFFEMVSDDLDDWSALCPEDTLPELRAMQDNDSFMAATCQFPPYDQDTSGSLTL